MKKMSFLLLLLMVLGLACKKDPSFEATYLRFDQANLQLAPVTGVESDLKLQSNTAWKITISPADADWLSVSLKEGNGNATIKVTVLKEFAGIPRTAEITAFPSQGNGSTQAKVQVTQKDYTVEKAWDRVITGNNGAYISGILETANGDLVLAATTASQKGGDIGANTHGGTDFLVIKLKTNRDTAWSKVLGGTDDDEASCITKSHDGGYVVAGFTNSNQSGDVGSNHGPQGSTDVWVVKLKENGDTAWTRTVGDFRDQYVYSIISTPDQGFLLAGEYYGTTGDAYIIKLNSSGVVEWTRNLGGSGSDGALSLTLGNDGGFVITGYTDSNNSGDVPASKGNGDFWVAKLNSTGNTAPTFVWSKVFGGLAFDYSSSIVAAADGNGYVVGGETSSSKDGDMSGMNKGKSDYWVLRIDNTGKKVWDINLGGNEWDECNSITSVSDGTFVLAGVTSSSNSGDVDGVVNGYQDYWLVKINAKGQKLWQKMYGTADYESPNSIITASDGSYIIGGYTGQNGYMVKTKDH